MSAENPAERGVLRGRLSDVGLPTVLAVLRETQRTGMVSLVNAGVRKSIYFLDGRLVFAASSLTQDRLGEVLLRGGKISADEYLRLSQRIRGGQRLGKALVESGVLSPKDLWWAIEHQIKEIVWSIFNWEDGYFHFEEDDLPRREKITFDLDVEKLVVEGIRRSDGTGAIREHFVSTDSLVERTDKDPPVELEPHERHVLQLADGKRTVLEICQESEIGEAETRKVLHTFLAIRTLKSRGPKQAPLQQTLNDGQDYAAVVDLYNEMFRNLFRHMSNEVGPIAEIILEKYLKELKERPGSLFERVRLRQDGALDPTQIERNLQRIPEDTRRDQLISSLNELLYSELLAVKRTLGASHESQLIQLFREMQNGGV
ncbi:MAG: hypothetical protein BMS9Abin37_2504 [Acidobacteriota bacterium]|nr:MAG: hypothetical protein BMS9Abin37_2504 [Acidobacteriota bacterium]